MRLYFNDVERGTVRDRTAAIVSAKHDGWRVQLRVRDNSGLIKTYTLRRMHVHASAHDVYERHKNLGNVMHVLGFGSRRYLLVVPSMYTEHAYLYYAPEEMIYGDY